MIRPHLHIEVDLNFDVYHVRNTARRGGQKNICRKDKVDLAIYRLFGVIMFFLLSDRVIG